MVGSAPFLLRFDEWLGWQQPFFPENLFALRTQVDGVARGLWLDDDRKKFLQFHEAVPATQPIERGLGAGVQRRRLATVERGPEHGEPRR
ncbi:hypothetical protein [Streptomyces sp. NPDC002671]